MSRSPMQLRREHQAVVHTVDEEPIASQIGGLQQRHSYKVQLSTMEYKVLWWLKEGSRDNEIAQRLGISPRTVNHHVNRILGKLSARNRTQAVVKALSIRIIPLD